jgi:hypothetical protein
MYRQQMVDGIVLFYLQTNRTTQFAVGKTLNYCTLDKISINIKVIHHPICLPDILWHSGYLD